MFDFLDPQQREVDLVQLTTLVFLPALVGLIVLLIPRRLPEVARWVALFGSALTLMLALCTLVDYHRLLDSYSDRSTRSLYHPATRLDVRSETQAITEAEQRPIRSDDLLTRRPWIGKFQVDYALGVDGINLALVLLTCFIQLLVIIASWTITDHLRAYLALLMILQTGILGAFLALDLFLFYVFYEVMLLPMYFLVGLWGGANRKSAAIKFVIYTLLGSVCLLTALIALYTVDVRDFVPEEQVREQARELQRKDPDLAWADALARAEVHTFDYHVLSKVGQAVMLLQTGQESRLTVAGVPSEPGSVPLFSRGVNRTAALERLKNAAVAGKNFQYLIFLLLFLGFAVKVPIIPLHSWLPEAHVEAPTPVSMVLAGVLLKLGGYGLIRFAYPICPYAAFELSGWVGGIGVVSILYGALVALGQTDFKRLLAYSSISHMGYVLVGLASWSTPTMWEWGVNGAVFQMIAHGITATGLFFVVGVIYERAHHRELDRLGGLKEPMPLFSGLSAILIFASLGLPGLCGFVGEFQVILAAWSYSPALCVGAVLATILTAAYLLRAWQKAYLGMNNHTSTFPEATVRETTILIPLALLCIVLGLIPGLVVFQWVEPSIAGWIENLARLTP